MGVASPLHRGRVVVAAGVLAGAAFPLAMAPLDWVWCAFASLAVLFAVAALAPIRPAMLGAYAFGVGQFGVGVSWVYVSIHDYGGAGVVLSAAVTALFVLFMALFPLLAVVLGRALAGGPSMRLALTLPAAWVFVEWVRTWLFTGFPWLFAGYATLETPLSALVPVVGVLGASAVVAWTASLVVWAVVRPGLRSATVVLVMALSLGGILVALTDRAWTQPAGEPVRVALLQGNFSQDIKWDPDQLDRIQQRYATMTAESAGSDVIIWPETAIPARLDRVEGYVHAVARDVRQAGGALVLGIPVREWAPGGGYLYNSIIALSDEKDAYHKRHLVPYGEYVPFRDVFGRSLDFLGAPMADYSRGPWPEPLKLGDGLTAGATICYEVAYPRAVRRTAADVDFLINVSNDAWFGDSLAPAQHLQKARMRAAEVGRWMARSTNTGITAVIDHHGRVVERAPQFEVAKVDARVERRHGATPYARAGDGPVLVLLFAVLFGAGIASLRRERSASPWNR